MLRSALWPIAIMSIIHRSYVLWPATATSPTTSGRFTARSVNFRRGWDIYNEHFNYVDPHYLYPPGGTLLMAPFGYMPVFASRNWFIAVNTVAMIIAACLLVRLVRLRADVGGPARAAAGHVLHRIGDQHHRVHQHQRLRPAGRGAVLPVAAGGKVSDQWWAGVAIGLSLVVKPLLAPLLLLPLLNRQWRALVTAFVVPLVFNAAAWPLISDPMNFVTRTLPYISRHPRLLQQLDPGQRHLLRPADVADPAAAHRLRGARRREPVAAVPVLPRPRPAVLDG